MLLTFVTVAGCLLSSCLASPAPQGLDPSPAVDTEIPQDSACGYIVNTYDATGTYSSLANLLRQKCF